MIMDDRAEFADAAAVTGTAAATAIAGDVIDLQTTARDLGRGDGVRLRIEVDTTVLAAGGAANVTFKLVSDSTANLTTSPTTHWTSGAIAKGTLVAGYVIADIVLPSGTYERYLGVTFTPDTNDTTAGKINAYLVFDTPGNTPYPNAI